MKIKRLHHIAIICADIAKSKRFYTEILGFKIVCEVYRTERDSYKIDLSLNEEYLIELFSFPNSPQRSSRPEALGLRHIAFVVEDIEDAVLLLKSHQIDVEPVRIDQYTGKRFTFFADPDLLPLELYES